MSSLPVKLILCLLLAVQQSVSQLTSEQQRLLLDLHNQARSDATPIATNMEEMVRCSSLAGQTLIPQGVIAFNKRLSGFGPRDLHVVMQCSTYV